jgi:hypothetical protein
VIASAKKRVVAEVIPLSEQKQPAEEKVILTAKRRFGKENQESSQDDEPEKRGKFTLQGSFQPVATSEKPSFDFAKAFKQLQLNKPEQPASEPAKTADLNLSKEKKVFVNKNLFSNPTIRPLPPVRNLDNDRPTPKLESEEPPLIKENFLSSSKALKYKDEVANPPRLESPIVKSLFDFKGNEVYKEE